MLWPHLLMQVPAAPTGFWDPARKSATAIIENDTTIYSDVAHTRVRSTVGHSTGKRYVEMEALAIKAANQHVGFRSDAFASNDGYDGNWIGVYSWNTIITTGEAMGTYMNPYTVIRFAIDLDARKLWIGNPVGWFAGNPETGATPSVSGFAAGTYRVMGSPSGYQTNRRLKVPAAPTYTVPAGFQYWA